jgi:hypothetical protein
MARRPTYTAANVIRLHREPDTWAVTGEIPEPERGSMNVILSACLFTAGMVVGAALAALSLRGLS